MNEFEKANEYKALCEAADGLSMKKYGATAPEGWTVVDTQYDKGSNFKAVVYQKGDEYAICYPGTDKWSAKDHAANLKMGLFGESEQMRQADVYIKRFIDKNGCEDTKLTVIGHSEGGTEATYAGVSNGLRTVTFNAYGISKKLIDKNENYDKLVTNYRDPHDPVSKLKENIGKTYIVESTQNKFMSTTPFGAIQSHGIRMMGDCTTAEPIEEYKKSHPFFLDKISEAAVTRQDINDMDGDLYGVYEDELDNRMAENKIYSNADAAQKAASGDMIYVKPYTRDDGTEVKGYYRHAVTA